MGKMFPFTGDVDNGVTLTKEMLSTSSSATVCRTSLTVKSTDSGSTFTKLPVIVSPDLSLIEILLSRFELASFLAASCANKGVIGSNATAIRIPHRTKCFMTGRSFLWVVQFPFVIGHLKVKENNRLGDPVHPHQIDFHIVSQIRSVSPALWYAVATLHCRISGLMCRRVHLD